MAAKGKKRRAATERVRRQRQTKDVNEQLVVSGVRQHELTEAAENLNERLREEITERKQIEKALRESEERFRAIADNIPQLAWMAKPGTEGQVTWFNKAWLDYTGTTLEQNQGSGWQAVHHPDHAARVMAKFEHHVRECLDWEDTFPLRRRDGKFRWFLSRMNVIRDESGEAIRIFGTNTDVTEQRALEEELQQAQVQLAHRAVQLEHLVAERTAKLQETVGELEGFSSSITHDLRAPLRAMQSFSSMLLENNRAQLDETGKEYLRRITTAASRMDKLILDVLAYSSVLRMDLRLARVDVTSLLRGILESYPDFQEPQAEVGMEGEMPAVLGNEAALTQCFSNLLNNAIKFVAPGTKPRVKIWAEKVGRGTPGAPGTDAPCPVRLWFADNGIGIAPQYRDKIFETFQRLNPSYEGTGMGLTIVRKAVERMGGKVGVESDPGQGSRFWLELKPAEPEGKTYEHSDHSLR